jgi:hypothetical protein
MKKRVKWMFFGMLAYAACSSLAQDIIGKEAYIERVQDYWIPAAISVPLAISAIIFIVVYRIFEVAKKELK